MGHCFVFTTYKKRDCSFISCNCIKRVLKCVAGVDSTVKDYSRNTKEGDTSMKLIFGLKLYLL